MESLFNKVAGLKACIFIKKETPTQVFSWEYCKTFQNTILKNIWKWPFKSNIFRSYRNQWIDIHCKALYWFPCVGNIYILNLLTLVFFGISHWNNQCQKQKQFLDWSAFYEWTRNCAKRWQRPLLWIFRKFSKHVCSDLSTGFFSPLPACFWIFIFCYFCHDIKNSHLICTKSHLTGFYIMANWP